MNNLLNKKKNQLAKKKKKGFTLVELIIVIAIIAILAAIAIPKFGEIRNSANTKDDLATAKNIATVIAQQMADGVITADVTSARTVESSITDKLDGSKLAKAGGDSNKGKSFKYTISGGNITIFYDDGTTKIYPAS